MACAASGSRGSVWASAILSGARSRMAWACGPSEWSGCGKDALSGGVASVVGARERGELDLIARDPGQHARVRPQQADGAGHDRVEHRLDIRLRAADDAQDVAGGGLRVQRRGQLAVARLELGEEAHVLHGDHGLVGEGLQERDLRRSENSADLEPERARWRRPRRCPANSGVASIVRWPNSVLRAPRPRGIRLLTRRRCRRCASWRSSTMARACHRPTTDRHPARVVVGVMRHERARRRPRRAARSPSTRTMNTSSTPAAAARRCRRSRRTPVGCRSASSQIT